MGDKKVSSVNTWSCRPPVGGRFDKTPLSFTQDSRSTLEICLLTQIDTFFLSVALL